MEIVKIKKPTKILNDLVKVQPLGTQTGQIISIKIKLLDCDFCDGYNYFICSRVYALYDSCLNKFPDTSYKDYHIVIKESISSIEIFYRNILISEYMYGIERRIDYFQEPINTYIHILNFKEELQSLKDINDKYITIANLADHGVYFQ